MRLADADGTELGELWARWRQGEYFDALPGGEHPGRVYQRTASAVAAAIQRSTSHGGVKQIVVVSHGGPIRLLVCGILQIPYRNWRQVGVSNASLTVIDVDLSGRAKLALLNDTCHLMHGALMNQAEAASDDAG